MASYKIIVSDEALRCHAQRAFILVMCNCNLDTYRWRAFIVVGRNCCVEDIEKRQYLRERVKSKYNSLQLTEYLGNMITGRNRSNPAARSML